VEMQKVQPKAQPALECRKKSQRKKDATGSFIELQYGIRNISARPGNEGLQLLGQSGATVQKGKWEFWREDLGDRRN